MTILMLPPCVSFCFSKAGFFRFAAYRMNDSESWHNYAACRQLVYGDFRGATECYLKAIEIDPKNSKAQVSATKTGTRATVRVKHL